MKRPVRSWLSFVVAASVAGMAPASARAGKRPPAVTPAGAAEARASAEAKAAGEADALLEHARASGDPLLFLAAGKARLAEADSPEAAELAREPARVALDILHFIKAGDASGRWKIIEPGDASAHITEAESLLQDIDVEIQRMEDEARAAEEAAARGEDDSVEDAPRERKPGAGLIGAGSALVVVGLGGAGMIGAGVSLSSSKQSEVEKVGPGNPAEVDRLDEEGKRANIIAYAGIGVAAVGLGVGIALIAIGAKKRKSGGGQDHSVMVSPAPGGLVLSGRF